MFHKSATALIVLITIVSLIHAKPAQAGLITVSPPSTQFEAGQVFDFTLSMPDLTNLTAYEVSLQLTSTTGTAGVDYFFVDATAASSNYLFASSGNFAATPVTDSSSRSRITLSDFDDNFGTDIVAGVNDQVATIQIGTASGFTGDLELTVDTGGLFLDQLDFSSPTWLSSVAEYNSVVTETAASGSTVLSPAAASVVPEPSMVMIMIVGALGMALPRRTRGEKPLRRLE